MSPIVVDMTAGWVKVLSAFEARSTAYRHSVNARLQPLGHR